MTEYGTVVGPQTAPPRVVSAEGAIVRLHFGRPDIHLTFELVFGSEGSDRFLMGPKTMRHAFACGGKMTICTPQELLMQQEPREGEAQPGDVSKLPLTKLRQLLGLRPDELRLGERIAWRTILKAYKR